MPQVTVIVPIHTGEDLLPAALRSILAQTLPEIEVIVAGDGAGTSVARAVAAARDPRLRFLPMPKAPGFGYSNRARAIAAAHSDRIAYLAPDDLWAPDHLSRLVGEQEREKYDLVFSRPVLVWGNGRPRPGYLPFDIAPGGRQLTGALLRFVSPSQTLHTREIHERSGGWNDWRKRHGDVDFWRRCRVVGARIGYLRHPTAVRFPSYAFRTESARGFLVDLRERLADDLIAGRLDLARPSAPPLVRIAAWLEDLVVVGRARGPGWFGSLFRRRSPS